MTTMQQQHRALVYSSKHEHEQSINQSSDKTRQNKTKQDKTRQNNQRQSRMAVDVPANIQRNPIPPI